MEEGSYVTQRNKVVEYLKENGSITSMEAFNMRITRLSAIIHTLRHQYDMNIATEMIRKTNAYGERVNYAKYILKEE